MTLLLRFEITPNNLAALPSFGSARAVESDTALLATALTQHGIVRILNSPHKKYTSLKRALQYHADGRAHYDRDSNTLLFRERAILIAERQRQADEVKGGWPWVQMDSGKRESTGYADSGLAMQVMQYLTPKETVKA